MTHSYELNENDIREIIAEKFNCSPRCVYIRVEKEYILMASRETIKATVHSNNKIGG